MTDNSNVNNTQSHQGKHQGKQKHESHHNSGRTNQQKRRRGNGNKRNSNSNSNSQGRTEKLSRALSWSLRHQGPSIGLSMTSNGYVPVSQFLQSKHPRLQASPPWTLQDIQEIVETSDKQRFQLEQRPTQDYPVSTVAEENEKMLPSEKEDTVLCIRATQGHTLKFIDSELLLTPVPPDELARIPVILHGTYQQPWQTSISKQGLNRMKRNHIHFAAGLPNDSGDNSNSNNNSSNKSGRVISGMRTSSNVYIYLDAAKCAADPNLQFYRSANGVLLTAGVKGQGTVPVEYFSHVTDSKGTILLDQRTTSSS